MGSDAGSWRRLRRLELASLPVATQADSLVPSALLVPYLVPNLTRPNLTFVSNIMIQGSMGTVATLAGSQYSGTNLTLSLRFDGIWRRVEERDIYRVSVECLYSALEGVLKVSGGFLEGVWSVWKISERCLEGLLCFGIRSFSGEQIEDVMMVFVRCLKIKW